MQTRSQPIQSPWAIVARTRVTCAAITSAMLALGCVRESPPPASTLVRVVAQEDSVPGVSLFLADGMAEEIGDALARTPGVRTVVRRRAHVSIAPDSLQGVITAESAPHASEPEYTLTLSAAYALGRDTLTPMRVRLVSTLTTHDTAGPTRVAWKDSVEFPLDEFVVERGRIVYDVLQHAGAIRTASSASVDSTALPARRDAITWLEAFQGWRALHAGGKDNMEIAFLHFKRALERDSSFARAYLGLALASAEYVDMQTGPSAVADASAALRIAARSVQRARALDSGLVDAHVLAAVIQYKNASAMDADVVRGVTNARGSAAAVISLKPWSRRAMDTMRVAITLDPERAGSYAALGVAAFESGNAAAALPAAERAVALDQNNVRWRALRMLAHVQLRNHAAAFVDCVTFAGSGGLCAVLWSDSTASVERARIISAALARSAGTSEGTSIVPLLEGVLCPSRTVVGARVVRAGDSAAPDLASEINARVFAVQAEVMQSNYPLAEGWSRMGWTRAFRGDAAWMAYVRERAMPDGRR